jgi:membrane protease YdiL (CAAX protease family)
MTSIPPPLAYPHPGPPPELPELPEGAGPRDPRWPAWTAPVALLAGFVAALIGAIMLAAVAGASGADIDNLPPGVEIGATVFQDLALIASAVLFARLWRRPRPWHFGLRRTRLWPAVGWTMLVWAGFFAVSAIWIAALGIHDRDELPEQLGADKSTAALVAVAALVCIVAPIAEEFFFRGYFFTALRTWRGPWLAAVLTGLVFGAIHFSPDRPAAFLLPLAVFGFGLCLLYWRTGSLYPCMALHALNNSLALGVSQHWNAWQVVLTMAVANVAIAAIMLPVGDRRPAPRPA